MKKIFKNKNNLIIGLCAIVLLMGIGFAAFSQRLSIKETSSSDSNWNVYISDVSVNSKSDKATGSGLYSDEYEAGRYIYRGSSPDNYLTLGDDSYRIISKEADGTLKVIKSESIGNMPFDLGYYTEIEGEKRYSNDKTDFCYGFVFSSEEEYSGCKVWGSKITMLNSNEKI